MAPRLVHSYYHIKARNVVKWLIPLLVLTYHCVAESAPDLSKTPEDLSSLPLNKLLTLKKSLITRAAGEGNGTAQALPWSDHRGGGGGGGVWIEETEPWSGGGGGGGGGWHPFGGGKSKHKKVQAIFQGTISILAFLAFAAYVICMVLQAFKSKQALTMTLATTVEPETRHRAYGDPRLGEEMYSALRRLAEGYARYEHCSRETCP